MRRRKRRSSNETDSSVESLPQGRFRIVLFLLFLGCIVLIFLASYFTPDLSYATVTIPIVFLAITIISHRNQWGLNKYWSVFYAIFIFSFVLYGRHIILDLSPFPADWHSTLNGLVFIQLIDSLVVIVPIIILTKVAGGTMASIFLKRGNLHLGLLVGIPIFIILFFISAIIVETVANSTGTKPITYQHLFSLTPYILILSLSNGPKDELWFRGLFLKKYSPLLGFTLGNVLQSLTFALNGLGAEYQSVLVFFAIASFLIALGLGYFMRKTDSIIGPSIIQAGADIPIFLVVILTAVH